ncbi:hypothetical protein KAR91_81245 [Candidatus Pacearchaeota archaeon]|nr:hypothetical protein [Candidatus Pacearchaeota archaeon]
MKATYNPKGDYFGYLNHCIGKEYEFEYLSTFDGIMRFRTADKNFGSASPVLETDLEFKEPFGESVYRMIDAGWEFYTGKCPPPESMDGYEFCIMDDFVFKKLK